MPDFAIPTPPAAANAFPLSVKAWATPAPVPVATPFFGTLAAPTPNDKAVASPFPEIACDVVVPKAVAVGVASCLPSLRNSCPYEKATTRATQMILTVFILRFLIIQLRFSGTYI